VFPTSVSQIFFVRAKQCFVCSVNWVFKYYLLELADLTAEARIQSQGIPCEICCWRHVTRTFLSKYFSLSLSATGIPSVLRILLYAHVPGKFPHKKRVSEIVGGIGKKVLSLFFFRPYTKAVPLLRRLVAGIILRCRACPCEICCGLSGRVTECPGTSVFLWQCNFSNAPYLSSLSWCRYQDKLSEPWSLPTSFPEVENGWTNGWIVLFALVVW